MCYKIMTKKVNIGLDNFLSLRNFKTRGHVFKTLKNKRSTKQVRCHSFSIRSVSDWNGLPFGCGPSGISKPIQKQTGQALER